MQPKCWIITGANGHFANTLVHELLAQGESVLGFVLPNDKSIALEGLGVDIVEGNIVDPLAIEHLIDECKADAKDICLIHAAGIVSIDFKEKELIHRVNVGGTRNIAEICLRKGVGRFVYISSVHAIPELPDKKNQRSHQIRSGSRRRTVCEIESGSDALSIALDRCGIIGESGLSFRDDRSQRLRMQPYDADGARLRGRTIESICGWRL